MHLQSTKDDDETTDSANTEDMEMQSDQDAERNVRSTKRPTKVRDQRLTTRREEAQEVMLLEKALSCMEKAESSERKMDDDIFAVSRH